MRLPDATDHIRLAPVRALRAVFSGVGQLLLAADRLREEDARQDQESSQGQQDTLAPWDGGLSPSVRLLSPTGMPVPSSRGARSAPGGKSGLAAGGKPRRGGDRRTGGRQRRAAQPAAQAGRSGRHKHAAEAPRFRSLDLTGNVRMLGDQDIAELAAETGSLVWSETAPPPTAPPPAALPIDGYDDLSLPSLRARLRNLGPADLRDLIAHERSHANREDVVAMFERRIVKLEKADD